MCTDCHNPHPNSHVQQVVDIRHTNVRRPERMPMAVQEPDTCYKCHPKTQGQSLLPSHHPILEGKMVCSSCHDSHGQNLRLLKEPTVNLASSHRCHMEKNGPFVHEHPPVTEDCTICHNPHGSVTNNLLHQPATYLCLHRCALRPTAPGPRITTRPCCPTSAGTRSCRPRSSAIARSTAAGFHGDDLPSPHNPRVYAR